MEAWLKYQNGFPIARIARELGVSERMVYYYIRDWIENSQDLIRLGEQVVKLPKVKDEIEDEVEAYRKDFRLW
jgi:transposase-like protein